MRRDGAELHKHGMVFVSVLAMVEAMSASSLVFLFILSVAVAFSADAPRITLDFELYAQGRYVYERNCIICHGARGDGQGEMSKTIMPKPRSFREGMFKFRSTPWDKLPTEDDLRRTITGGLTGTAMGMFTQLQSDDVTAVIEYVKSFSRRWRKAARPAQSARRRRSRRTVPRTSGSTSDSPSPGRTAAAAHHPR